MLVIDRAEQRIRPIGYITSLGPSQSTTKPFPKGVPKRKKFAFGSENKKYSRYHEKEAQDKQKPEQLHRDTTNKKRRIKQNQVQGGYQSLRYSS